VVLDFSAQRFNSNLHRVRHAKPLHSIFAQQDRNLTILLSTGGSGILE
jgi:hypothetical protein